MKASEIKGFVPNKKSEDHEKFPTRKRMTEIGMIYGFNEAISKISEKELTLNREGLAKIIADKKSGQVGKFIPNKYDYELSDAIIKDLPELLEVRE